jgi:hypothetical protein
MPTPSPPPPTPTEGIDKSSFFFYHKEWNVLEPTKSRVRKRWN